MKKTGPAYDKMKAKIAAEESKRLRRQMKRLNRREIDAFKLQLIKAGVSSAVEKGTGRILVRAAFDKVSEFRKRMKDGRCPTCGVGLEFEDRAERDSEGRVKKVRGDKLCKSCAKGAANLPSVDASRVKMGNHTQGIRGIPDGQNMNGLVYCAKGHRLFMGDNGLPIPDGCPDA